MSGDLIDTTEMYLRTVYELIEEGIEPLRARIVERLHQSSPTVSQTVARLERDGLLSVENDRSLKLSETGWQRSANVMRKHRIAECMLEKIGIEWQDLHDEACRLEHVISDRLEARLEEILHSPAFSPYGNPIPRQKSDPDVFRFGAQKLSDVLGTETVTAQLARISESVQADLSTITAIAETGIRPGRVFKAKKINDDLALAGSEGQVRVAPDVAYGLWLKKPDHKTA